MSLLDVVLFLLGLPVAAQAFYLCALALLARPSKGVASGPPRWKFDLIVPAHNEELGIAQTIHSLSQLDYPPPLRRIWVVADNCTDGTAQKAEEAGARVLVRVDPQRRGKGYALELAFEKSLEGGFADAVVVVDADTSVSGNLLKALGQALDNGAQAVQVSYGVRNPTASWRTRLMTLALALFNDLRSLGRERLGLSVGLKGNGMCFTHSVLKQVPHQAYSVVEDLEYGIRLGRAGYRVFYVHEAQVKGEMVATEKASRSQRRRWEGGRWVMAKQHALGLVRDGLSRRSAVLFDLGLDLLIPPLSYLVLAAGSLSGLAAGLALHRGSLFSLPFALMLSADAALLLYVLKGWALSKVGARGLVDLLWAPIYVGWKLMLLLGRPARSRQEWVRTATQRRVLCQWLVKEKKRC